MRNQNLTHYKPQDEKTNQRTKNNQNRSFFLFNDSDNSGNKGRYGGGSGTKHGYADPKVIKKCFSTLLLKDGNNSYTSCKQQKEGDDQTNRPFT